MTTLSDILAEIVQQKKELLKLQPNEYDGKINDIVKDIQALPNQKKPRIKTLDRTTTITMYTANDLILNIATGLIYLTQSLYKIFSHPKYSDQVERSSDMVKEMHEIFLYQILPILHDNITEIIEGANYNALQFTTTKTDFKKMLSDPQTLHKHCKEFSDFCSQYKINIEEFYELTGKKMITYFGDIILMHFMPNWDRILLQQEKGELTNYELKFAADLQNAVNEFCAARDKAKHREERKKVTQNLKEYL
jgi:hypothetical protein